MRQALEMALEALEKIAIVNAMDYEYQQWAKEYLAAIKEALEQPEPEAAPVAKNEDGRIKWLVDDWPQNCLLYTHTPQRTWVGLTDEEKKDLCRSWPSPMDAIYATESKLKDKNK